jgi:predicted ATPase
MLVAICGSQGSGKSTTLNEIKKMGFNVVERKTSRSILKDWDVTLEEVNADPELTLKFQSEITKRKYEDELQYVDSPDLWFTERTHTDLFVYALASLGKVNKHSEWIDDYYNTCKEHNSAYMATFLLPAGVFEVEHDGVRGSNEHYAKNISMLMSHYQQEMMDKNSRILTVSSEEPYMRALEILSNSWQLLYNRETNKRIIAKRNAENNEIYEDGFPKKL